jgi:tetratricopeptide (TPR) repeat protein
MASLESDERNIMEVEEFNWRLVVYPLLALVAAVLIGFAVYYYHLSQHEQAEEQAAAALATAKTPAEIEKIAAQYPDTIQSAVGLMRAGDLSFTQKDFDGAAKAYQRVIDSSAAPGELRDSARLGLASAQEGSGNADDAIKTYLDVAHKGNQSGFAPVAYYQAAAIYGDRKDTVHEQQILQEAVRLGGDSPFVKDAEDRLKTLAPGAPNAAPMSAPPAP